MILNIIPIPTELAAHIRGGGEDALGRTAERLTSTGPGHPCRCCLRNIEKGMSVLLFTYAPNPPGPFWEAGPVFIHEADCKRRHCNGRLPAIARTGPRTIRAYDAENRIAYAHNRLVADPAGLENALREALSAAEVAYVHVRAAAAGCYAFRVERA